MAQWNIRKNAQSGNGDFSQLWRILSQNFISLMVINLHFIVFSIPLFTMGPALAALNQMSCMLAEGQHIIYPGKEFRSAFRKNFKQGFFAGIVGIGYVAVLVYSVFLLRTLKVNSFFLNMVLLLSALLFLTTALYFFPQMAMVNLPLRRILENSISLALVNVPKTLLALVCGGVVPLVVPLLGMPITGIFYLLILFSASAVICCTFIWPTIRRYVVNDVC